MVFVSIFVLLFILTSAMDVIAFKSLDWIICDIEGTTTSISFVKDVLFPEARKNLVQFLIDNRKDIIVLNALKDFWKTYLEDKKERKENLPDVDFSKIALNEEEFDERNLIPFVLYYDWLMKLDRKLGSLKTIQGMIWKKGYEDGSIKGHVYPEVRDCFEKWSKICNIAIYSSGSVQAQKLLFSNSEAGDLTCYIKQYFDTVNAGSKLDPSSYKIIADKLKINPQKVLFLTDIFDEYSAAKKMEMNSVIVDRKKNLNLKSLESISTFDQLSINT